MSAFALTIFTGAFLLFQVQPLIGKFILPWFGGGPGVWTTCMLFFQVLLLAGYAYAHLSSRYLKPQIQSIVHLALLAAALALLPIAPNDSWKPLSTDNPVLHILLLLTATLGLPYFVLSSTGPLLQQWFSRANPGKSPYRLYALSNLGSLLALLTYPFLFENHFTRKTQTTLWAWGLVAYALFSAWSALKSLRHTASPPPDPSSGRSALTRADQLSILNPQPSTLNRLLWLLLPASASVLLLAVTNKLCQDVAVIPFLWVLPLSLYLLSFIICFDSPRWYLRFPLALAFIAFSAAIAWALFHGNDLPLYQQIIVYAGGLFLGCMLCHGELYGLRPDPRQLTSFYLTIAAGGALGGLLVAVVAPLIFDDYYELHLGLFLCALLFFIVCVTTISASAPSSSLAAPKRSEGASSLRLSLALKLHLSWRSFACLLTVLGFVGLDRFLNEFGDDPTPGRFRWSIVWRILAWLSLLVLAVFAFLRNKFRTFQHWKPLAGVWLFIGLASLGLSLWLQGRKEGTEAVYRYRNFYGVLTLYDHEPEDPKSRYLLLEHGRITHGLQFVDPAESRWPTSYYGKESGVGLALDALAPGQRRVGLVGLGTGTLTAYGQKGDFFRIYEINPEVARLALSRFTFITNCPATVQIALGDARLSLETDPPQNFDLLVLDAFSSDAIPVHLLTAQAFDLYQRHLKTNAVIAIHISNHYLDLEPVVINLANKFKYKLAAIDYDENEEEWWLYPSTWLLLSRSDTVVKSPAVREASYPLKTNAPAVLLWTDDFASLFQILK